MHNPTVGTFAGFIVEPIDVLTMDIHIPMGDILLTPMEDILLTPMGDILLTPMGDILVHPFSGDGTNAIGTRQAQKVDRCGINLHARLQRPQDYQES
jgi:hypothetical protein